MPENTVLACQNEITDVPGWLNEQYVEKVLRCALKEGSIKLKQLTIDYAVPKGDNFASIIYRIRVTYHARDQEYETTSTFIVKGMITEGLAGEKLRQYDVQRKEMDVYQFVVPELKRMMKSVGERSELYPSALAVDRKHEVILFKDLAQDGYRMADRTKGMDMAHLKMAITMMAKLHAGSMKLREQDPTIFEHYRTGMITRETEAFHPMFVLIYDALVDEVAGWGPEWGTYHRKLEILRPNFVEYGLRVFDNDPDAEDLCVFVHGDLWVNNLLYKYDTQGTPCDAVLLDFQYCCYGTPMIDFCYLYYTSARDDIRQSCLDELLQYYYYALVGCARDLQYHGKIPTLHQFLQQAMRKMFYGVYSSFIALPVQMNDKTENADFEALMGDDERAQIYKRTIVSNVKYRKIIQGLLPQFDRKGLLDPLY
uniref:CHK domain-containing protein n=1 Tax=Anopheles atroparvus TaxID=41427 RepID=A0A182JJY9_ANOAO